MVLLVGVRCCSISLRNGKRFACIQSSPLQVMQIMHRVSHSPVVSSNRWGAHALRPGKVHGGRAVLLGFAQAWPWIR